MQTIGPLGSWIASAMWLSALCLMILYIVRRKLVAPGPYTLWERCLYAPAYTLARLLWRVEICWDPRWGESEQRDSRMKHGQLLRERIRGGAVLIANHRSSVDPFFIQLAAGARVHWMVAAEYFPHPLFGPLLRSYMAIPTRRGGADNGATKLAIRYASQGGFVGMFPEGRINRTDAPLLTIRPGAALVAAKSDVPLVPIWIEGAPVGPEVYSALLMPAKVSVTVGFPVARPVENLAAPQSTLDLDSTAESSENENLAAVESGVSKQSRAKHLLWIEEAMNASLHLGNRTDNQVHFAGKGWVEN